MFRGAHVVIRPIEADDQAFITALNTDPAVRANVVSLDFRSPCTSRNAGSPIIPSRAPTAGW